MNVRSLEFRLTLLVTMACALILCLVGVLTYLGIDRILVREQDQALASRIERLEVLIQDSDNVQQIVAKPKIYQNMLGNQDNLFILIQGQQKLIDINPLNIPIPKLQASQQIAFFNVHQTGNATRLAWKNFSLNGVSYQLIAGKQWSERLGILYSFRDDLIKYLLLGVAMVSLLCWLLCRFGLRGLRELTEQTRQIDIQSLQHRIQVAHQSSEVQLLTDAINHMLQRIEAGYQQLNRFSENIAHEFRTPLNNLVGQTEILLSESRTSHDYEDLLVSHLEEYARLKRMIDSMLFLARADQQQIQLHTELLNVQDALEDLLSFYDLMASEKHIEISAQLEANSVVADHQLFQRAVSNLIENAILHGVEHGKIEVKVQQHVLDTRTYVEIAVLTQGVQIEAQHLPHVFERFYQCESSRHQQGRSGGLGLSIVASIMQLHNGRASVHQSENGVCFTLDFPVN